MDGKTIHQPAPKPGFRLRIGGKDLELPRVAKLRKPAELVAAFTAGTLSYNLFYSMYKNGTNITQDPEQYPNEDCEDMEGCGTLDQVIGTNATLVTGVSDDMSFGEAFQAAREQSGPGHFFEWRGRHYNTYTQEEYEALSEAEVRDFAEQYATATDEAPIPVETAPVDTEGEEGLAQATSEPVLREPTPEDEAFMPPADGQAAAGTAAAPSANVQQYRLDEDGDGQTDAILVSHDDDAQAEIVYVPSPDGSTVMALIDVDNTGMLSAVGEVTADGEVVNVTPLEEPLQAPAIPSSQVMDMNSDGRPDAVAQDANGDQLADRVLFDSNGDATADMLFLDTDGDGSLDAVFPIVNDTIGEGTALEEPFPVAMLDATLDGDATAPVEDSQLADENADPIDALDTDTDDAEEEIEGLDNDADIADFL